MANGPLSINFNSAFNVLTRTMADLGLTLPETLTTKIATYEAATVIPASLLPDSTKAANKWFDLAVNGKDPSTDKEVLALLTRTREPLHALEVGLQTRADQAKADALTEATDDIIDTLRAVVTQAMEDIDEAKATLGPVLTEARPGRLTPDGHRQHAVAREAFMRTDTAVRAWSVLARRQGTTWRAGTVDEVLIFADVSARNLAEVGKHIGQAKNSGATTPVVDTFDARTVVHLGHRLDLATIAGYRERVAKIVKQRADQKAAREAEFRSDLRGGAFPVPVLSAGPGWIGPEPETTGLS